MILTLQSSAKTQTNAYLKTGNAMARMTVQVVLMKQAAVSPLSLSFSLPHSLTLVLPLCMTMFSLYPANIPSTCSVGAFTCESGECMLASVVCDGTTDCPDESDEDSSLCCTLLYPLTHAHLSLSTHIRCR